MGRVGIGRWTAFSLETRPDAPRIFGISHGDVTIIGRCGGRGKEGREKEREREKKNRMGRRGGKDEGHARPSSRGRRSGVVVPKGVVARENIAF